MLKNLTHYSKALVAIGAAIGVTGAVLADGAVDSTEIEALAAAWVGAFAVWRVTNTPKLAPVNEPDA